MNKVIIPFFLFISLLKVSAQETTTPILSKETYLKKSKVQKTTAWLLLASGTGLLIGSAATFEFDFFGTTTYDNATSTFLGFGSIGAFIGSGVYFSLARETRKKAALVTLSRQRIFFSHQRNATNQTMPAINLKIPL